MKIPVKASELNADLISLSAHKIYGGKGVGALYIKKNVRLKNLIFGGSQEKGMRPGTENVPMIAGFGEAVRVLSGSIQKRYDGISRLKSMFCERISKNDGIIINSGDECLPYIINISVPGIRSEIMLHFLEEKEIYVSSGSACSKGAKSGVLSEFRLSHELSDSALRISLSHETTVQELRILAEAIENGMQKLQRKSG